MPAQCAPLVGHTRLHQESGTSPGARAEPLAAHHHDEARVRRFRDMVAVPGVQAADGTPRDILVEMFASLSHLPSADVGEVAGDGGGGGHLRTDEVGAASAALAAFEVAV